MCGFIAQLLEHRTGIAEVTGSNPVEALIFFRLLLSNCLNWQICCDDHPSLSKYTFRYIKEVGGMVASWLVRSTPERAVRVRALAGDIVLCSSARHLTLTVPLSTQVYKWVNGKLLGKPNKLRGSVQRK